MSKTNTKTTKRALLCSIMSLIICFAMLIGTTFAWFTDSVSSTGNKIQAGTLNIDLFVKGDDGYKSVKADKAAIFNYDKWEPGYTEVKNIMVKTTGNLALKYTLKITAKGEVSKLAEVIDVYYAASDVAVADRTLAGLTKIGTLKDVLDGVDGTIINDTLIPGSDDDDFATIALKMQETAGNEYQGLSIGSSFDLNLVATQYTYEQDSFDDQYDKDAKYELVKFAFDNPAEEIAFCPNCYNEGTTDNHANHGKYIKIENGVAKVEQNGAWLNFANLDWDNNSYFLEYDVDLSELANGAFVAFDSGETATWQDLQLGFKRENDAIKAYKTLSATSLNATTELGVLGDNIHVVYKYSVNETNALDMQMVISDGANTYTVTKTVNNFNKNATICWDVYTTDSGSGTYATLDNFVFSSLSK